MRTDALTLDVHANVVARLQEAAAEEVAESDEEEEASGPLALAIDVQDAGAGEANADAKVSLLVLGDSN